MTDATLPQWLQRLETIHPRAMDLGLERITSVASALGLLPVTRPVVTVAGTNGKGSTVAVLEAILAECGRQTGVFTSPHLLRFNERIRVSGCEAPDSEIVAAFEAIERARGMTSLTYFEFAALAALLVFRQRQVDILILEVGLGGRLDAVNIVDPTVAVITSIALDHQDWLGDDRGSIAREKAGILRAGAAAVIADPEPPPELLEAAGNAAAAPVLCLGKDFTVQLEDNTWRGTLRTAAGQPRSLPVQARGSLLPGNVCAALQAALLLGQEYSDAQVARALAAAQPRGRCESWSRNGRHYLLDVAHNPAAVKNMIEYLEITPCKGKTIALFSVMADKDIDGMIRAASGSIDAWYVADQADNARAASAAVLAAALRAGGQDRVVTSSTIEGALAHAQGALGAGDRLVIFGSFFTVAQVLPLLPPGLANTGREARA